MKAKEYLSQAMALKGRIDARMEQIARIKAMAERGKRLAADSGNWQAALEQMGALEAELQADVRLWADQKRQIGETIESVDKPVHRQLLEYRYLCGWDWRKIAGRMHYSIDRVWHIHSEALREIRVPELPRC